jgi:hypothetical protein
MSVRADSSARLGDKSQEYIVIFAGFMTGSVSPQLPVRGMLSEQSINFATTTGARVYLCCHRAARHLISSSCWALIAKLSTSTDSS